MKYLRKIIGKLTLPKNVYVCELGDYWVPSFCPSHPQPYDYANIKQNWWGVWEEQTYWLSVWNPLEKLGE